MAKDWAKEEDSSQLAEQIARLIENAKRHIAAQVNSTMVYTYYEIGRLIVEYEQNGEERAEYGKGTFSVLSKNLSKKFGRGFSVDNLENMRRFYLTYSNAISETVSRKSLVQKSESLSRISVDVNKSDGRLFALSWSHYLFLMRIRRKIQ